MTITETAQKRVRSILGEKEYLRIKIAGGGCSGHRIGLEKEQKKEIDDVEVLKDILTDPISAEFLNEAVLDWTDDSFQSEFKFDIPNTYSCGCGSSFQFK